MTLRRPQFLGEKYIDGYKNDERMDFLQIIFEEEKLCHAMLVFSRNVLLLSIIISLITAGLVYYSLSCLLIRPVRKITDSMVASVAHTHTYPSASTSATSPRS